MKVKGMIEKLMQLDPEMDVIHHDGDYGDIEVLEVKVKDFYVEIDKEGNKDFYSPRFFGSNRPNAKVAVIK